MAAEHRGGGADHDDFSLRASSHAAPRRALAGPSATRPRDGDGEGRAGVTAALGPNTCSGA